jgi:hypothetical protein
MTRGDAIAWLRSMGRDARARDWALGKTIVIPIGEPEGEIEVYPGAVYLYPAEDGTWRLRDFGVVEAAESSYDDLEAAIHGAHEYIGRRERELRVERG